MHLALYELDDPELENLLVTHQKRLDLILCTAGSKSPPKGSGLPVTWDVTNQPVRAKLQKLMGPRLQNRMFNNSDHIGHNKFAVLLDKHGKPTTVWTGSTNWTPTGLCAQTNNTIILTFWITGVVFAAVVLFMAYCVFRFRHREGTQAAYEPENRRLESWLTIVTGSPSDSASSTRS